MKTIAAIFLMFSLSAPVFAVDPMSRTDIVLELVFFGIYAVDWGQTLAITNHEDNGYYEINPVIGKHPSRARVNTVFAACALGQIAGTILLPARYNFFGAAVHPRRIWQLAFIGVSSACVVNNFRIGLHVEF
jgi:hypothetical protein